MMAMVGSFVGPFGVLLTIFGGSVSGAAVGLAMIPLRGRTLRDTLPFGCFLAPAAVLALLSTGRIWTWYWSALAPPP
jgi:leader peptidase (prepilin peptidase)/N-methyltransferase